MEQTAKAKSRSRFIRRPFRVIVIVTVALCAAAILALGTAIHSYQAQTQALKDQAAQLEQENGQLKDKNDKKGTLEGLLEFAQDFLGLVDPDSVIFGSED